MDPKKKIRRSTTSFEVVEHRVVGEVEMTPGGIGDGYIVAAAKLIQEQVDRNGQNARFEFEVPDGPDVRIMVDWAR